MENDNILGQYYVPELECLILEHLDPVRDYGNLVKVNRYYYALIGNGKIYKEFREFYATKDELKLKLTKKDLNYKKIYKLNDNLCKAFGSGYLNVATYFLKKYRSKGNHSIYNCGEDFLFRLSCASGNLDLCKHLYNLGLKFNKRINIHARDENPFISACGSGNYDLVLWLANIYATTKTEERILRKSYEAFMETCKVGNMEIIQWLYDYNLRKNPRPFWHQTKKLMSSFKLACTNGHLDLVKWFWHLFKNKLDIRDSSLFHCAVRSGNLEFVKWFYKTDPEFSLERLSYGAHLFSRIANMEIMQWLFDKSVELDHPFFDERDELFEWRCRNGDLEIVKWIFEMNDLYNLEVMDLHIHGDLPFILACENGHLELAKWLWQKSIDLRSPIVVGVEKLIPRIYSLNFSDILKWLCQICIENNIKVRIDDYYFRSACITNRLEVAKCLSQFDSRYYVEEENGKIKYWKIKWKHCEII